MAALTEGRRWLIGGRLVAKVFREWSSSRFAACRAKVLTSKPRSSMTSPAEIGDGDDSSSIWS
jgi:hypothetical protein